MTPTEARKGKVTLDSVRAKRRDRKTAGKTALADDRTAELPSDLADEDARWREEMRERYVKQANAVLDTATDSEKVAPKPPVKEH